MRQQILVRLTTGHCAEETDATETCCESKIQAAADRLGVPREWQVQRSIAEIWAMHRHGSRFRPETISLIALHSIGAYSRRSARRLPLLNRRQFCRGQKSRPQR